MTSPDAITAQDYLGVERESYRPVERGYERELAERLVTIRAKLRESKQAKPEVPKPVRPGSGATTQPNTAAQKALERLRRDPNDLDALASVVG